MEIPQSLSLSFAMSLREDRMNRDHLQKAVHIHLDRVWITLKWIIFAVICGIIAGIIGSLFDIGIELATDLRVSYPWLIYLLPLGGACIFFYYHLLDGDDSIGTNLVISSIQSGDHIRKRMIPAIFFSSIFSHLLGASVGREGAALQLGGSIGYNLGKTFRLPRHNQHVMIMCGMSAVFSAVFGTPVAAAIFAMEVVSVGIMHYAALVPCVVASFVARGIAIFFFRIPNAGYPLGNIPEFTLASALPVLGLAVIAGFVSILECVSFRKVEVWSERLLANRYLRAVLLGTILLLLTLLVGKPTYNGLGIDSIAAAAAGNAPDLLWYSFLLKILFTALSLAAGYKGGEIVPTLFIGSALGYAFGSLVGFSPALCSSVAVGALFCGVTNSPITSIILCIELFGIRGLPYYVLAIAISYAASSYYGLYSAQKIVYSKYRSNYINTDAK